MAVKKARAKKRAPRVVKKRPVRKKVVKKRAVRKVTPKKPQVKGIKEKVIGLVTHYFPRVKAAAIKLKMPLSMGDSVRIKGHTTDFTQVVSSLQIDCKDITTATKGKEIGLLVNSRVRRKDAVYKV